MPYTTCITNLSDAVRYKQELAPSQGEKSLLEDSIKKREQVLSELSTELLIRKNLDDLELIKSIIKGHITSAEDRRQVVS